VEQEKSPSHDKSCNPQLVSLDSGLPTEPDALASHPLSDILSHPHKNRSSGFKWILSSGAIFLLGLGGVWGFRALIVKQVSPIEVITAPVGRGDITVTTTETGTVELGGQQTFKAPSDITVQAIRIRERQRVTAGSALKIVRYVIVAKPRFVMTFLLSRLLLISYPLIRKSDEYI
jgi:hypothetical protein